MEAIVTAEEVKVDPLRSIDPRVKDHVVLRDLRTIRILDGRGRKKFDKIPSLADSIKRLGLIQPIVIVASKTEEGKYDLVAGERRTRAYYLLAAGDPSFMQIPTIEREYASETIKKEIELEENSQRENLEWPEHCSLVEQIDTLKREIHGSKMQGQEDGEGWSVQKTADHFGQTRSTTTRQIDIAKKMKDRPDIAERIKHLPMNVAIKEFKRMEDVEKTERLAASGAIILSDDLMEGDCLEKLSTISSETIDLICTDPPFGISNIEEAEGESRGDTKSYTALLKADDNSNTSDVQKLMSGVIPELFRVMKPSAHIYIFMAMDQYQFLSDTMTKVGFIVDPAPIIWDKDRATSAFLGYDYCPCYEPILYAHKPPKAKRLHDSCRKILRFSPPPRAIRTHPFQKPEELLSYIIKQSSNIGDRILDPFAGSGSLLLAGTKLGRSVVGIEKNRERFLDAQSKLLALKAASKPSVIT